MALLIVGQSVGRKLVLRRGDLALEREKEGVKLEKVRNFLWLQNLVWSGGSPRRPRRVAPQTHVALQRATDTEHLDHAVAVR